jgi:uncharacterized protein (DUF2147 family)
MFGRFGLALCALALACSAAQSASAPAGDPAGRWLTQTGNVEVEIAPCGDALCGTIVKVLANRSMSGPGAMKAKDDRDPLGMRILIDLVATERQGGVATEWEGHVYNRETAKTYDAVVTLESPDRLVVRGYVGIPLFGKTQTWTRVLGGR